MPASAAFRDEARPRLIAMAADGRLVVPVARTFALDAAPEALALLQSGHPGASSRSCPEPCARSAHAHGMDGASRRPVQGARRAATAWGSPSSRRVRSRQSWRIGFLNSADAARALNVHPSTLRVGPRPGSSRQPTHRRQPFPMGHRRAAPPGARARRRRQPAAHVRVCRHALCARTSSSCGSAPEVPAALHEESTIAQGAQFLYSSGQPPLCGGVGSEPGKFPPAPKTAVSDGVPGSRSV